MYVVYMSVQYDDDSCCWPVAKPIVRPSEVATVRLWTAISTLMFLPSIQSICLGNGTQSNSPYLLLSIVNEPVSQSVRIIMRPIIHVGRYFKNINGQKYLEYYKA